ncbi:hypothetical protein BHE74_00053415 [Ensete ventricosum]|nr:hypothetical protein BHE74_00053415 [Ensete ventricosum]
MAIPQGAAAYGHDRLRPAHKGGLPPVASPTASRDGIGGANEARVDPRCHGRISRRIVMQQSDETDDEEINNHMTWRCANAHIDPIVSD